MSKISVDKENIQNSYISKFNVNLIDFNVVLRFPDIGFKLFRTPKTKFCGLSNSNIDGLSIKLDPIEGLNIEYYTHIKDLGDSAWFKCGRYCGTVDKNLPIEGVGFRLSGPEKDNYSIRCFVYDNKRIKIPPYKLEKNYYGTKYQNRPLSFIRVVLIKKN